MSDLSCDECRACGVWVNFWSDAAFYATQLCEDCRRKLPPGEIQANRGEVPNAPPSRAAIRSAMKSATAF